MFTGNAIISTAYIGVMTVSTLVSRQITGSTGSSGTPGMTAMLGVGFGAAALSSVSLKAGRRTTFSASYALAAVGAVLTGLSLLRSNMVLLLTGMFLIGFGRSAATLARFAAGDLRETDRRASAIGLIVWASAIGAVVGPLLIGPAGISAAAAGLDQLMGAVLIGGFGFAVASLLMAVGLRPEPLTLAIVERPASASTQPSSITVIVEVPSARLSLLTLTTNQFAMALLMVMTPLHVRANGGDLATVGWVMMALALGMFAVAPVTGYLIDRFGSRRFIAASIAILVTASLIAATASTANTATLVAGLFLLGVGWNLGFVAGTTLLQQGLPIADRIKIQGFAVTTSLISGAAAAALSGAIVAASSYSVLAIFGATVALIPLLPLYRARSA
ncbi:MAG: MFS transporter [Proteobacteria bacterium]|nr:MFS transporter [Pseudomonadota bacterium]